MVPSGATADDLTTEDTESDGQILRIYSFGGTQVGTAVVEAPSQESSSDVLENDENMVGFYGKKNSSICIRSKFWTV